jgi:hypothetical protein
LLEAELLKKAGRLAIQANRWVEARERLERAIALYAEAGDTQAGARERRARGRRYPPRPLRDATLLSFTDISRSPQPESGIVVRSRQRRSASSGLRRRLLARAVSTVRKSQASALTACRRRNTRHDEPARGGAKERGLTEDEVPCA